jgi:hypothetical protein
MWLPFAARVHPLAFAVEKLFQNAANVKRQYARILMMDGPRFEI